MGAILCADGIFVDCPRVRGVRLWPVMSGLLKIYLDVEAPAIDRCEAALKIPTNYLHEISSPRAVENMRRVARKLDPSLVARAREIKFGLQRLIEVVGTSDLEEQRERWNRIVMRSAEGVPRKPRGKKSNIGR